MITTPCCDMPVIGGVGRAGVFWQFSKECKIVPRLHQHLTVMLCPFDTERFSKDHNLDHLLPQVRKQVAQNRDHG